MRKKKQASGNGLIIALLIGGGILVIAVIVIVVVVASNANQPVPEKPRRVIQPGELFPKKAPEPSQSSAPEDAGAAGVSF